MKSLIMVLDTAHKALVKINDTSGTDATVRLEYLIGWWLIGVDN